MSHFLNHWFHQISEVPWIFGVQDATEDGFLVHSFLTLGAWRMFFVGATTSRGGYEKSRSLMQYPQGGYFPESFTLWLCQNSYWKWWFIVDFPIENGGSFHSFLYVYQAGYSHRDFHWCSEVLPFRWDVKHIYGWENLGDFGQLRKWSFFGRHFDIPGLVN